MLNVQYLTLICYELDYIPGLVLGAQTQKSDGTF